MTNRERYKKAFSAIQASGEFSLEVERMKRIKKQHMIKAMAASIAAHGSVVDAGRPHRRHDPVWRGWNL